MKGVVQVMVQCLLYMGRLVYQYYKPTSKLQILESKLEELFKVRDVKAMEEIIKEILNEDSLHLRTHEIQAQLLYESNDPSFLEAMRELLKISPCNELGLLLRSNWIDALELKLEIAHRKRQGKIMLRVAELLALDPENQLAHQIRVKYSFRYKHKQRLDYLETLLNIFPDDAVGRLFLEKEKSTSEMKC